MDSLTETGVTWHSILLSMIKILKTSMKKI